MALPDPGLMPPALLVLPRVVESLLSSELESQENKTINPAPVDALTKRGNWIKVCAHIHLQVTFFLSQHSCFLVYQIFTMHIHPSRTQPDRNHEWLHKIFKSNNSPLQK